MTIPDDIAYNIYISPASRLMYGYISACIEEFGVCEFSSQDVQMAFYGISRRTVNKWLLELEKHDLIRWHRGERSVKNKVFLNGKTKEKAL